MRFEREGRSRPAGATFARQAAVFACALAVATVRIAAAATIHLDAQRHGDAIDVRGSVALEADAATAWRVLTDYDRYTDFIPDLRASRVVARRGATVIVEQTGDAAVWLFRIPLSITFEISESPPTRLQSRAVAGSMPALVSRYTLTAVGPTVRLDYTGHIVAGLELLGRIEQSAVEHNVARQFQALADEIERQGAMARTHPAAGSWLGSEP